MGKEFFLLRESASLLSNSTLDSLNAIQKRMVADQRGKMFGSHVKLKEEDLLKCTTIGSAQCFMVSREAPVHFISKSVKTHETVRCKTFFSRGVKRNVTLCY